MTPNGAAILSHPDQRGHIVYPYTDETQVAEAVSVFAGAGLRNGEAILLVVLENHKSPIRQRLEAEGFDLRALESTGQLVWCDAQDLLAAFMFDGILDEHLFKTTIGDLIERAKIGDGNRRRPVRVFGEMVQIIWKANLRGTERLEELWNQVIEEHAVPLLCAYSLAGRELAIPQSILACHSHAIA